MPWIKYLVDRDNQKAGDVIFIDDSIAKKILVKDKVVECINPEGLPLVDATPEDQQAYKKTKKVKKTK